MSITWFDIIALLVLTENHGENDFKYLSNVRPQQDWKFLGGVLGMRSKTSRKINFRYNFVYFLQQLGRASAPS